MESHTGKSEYLGGKVVKCSLPVIPAPSGPDAPPLKRLMLPQGELAQIYDSEEGIRYMAVIETRPGGARGNHYHKIKREGIYVLQGSVVVVAEDSQTHARTSVPLEVGDLLLIQPGIAHLLKTVEPGQAIEFSQARFDKADIYSYRVEGAP
jgi:quercetin dioxygenase-like cupin family protein